MFVCANGTHCRSIQSAGYPEAGGKGSCDLPDVCAVMNLGNKKQ